METSNAESIASCNGICGSQNSCKTTVITPVKIVPITSTEESSNTYSIETKIPGGLGSIYTRQAEGDTAEELVASVHNNLIEIVIELFNCFFSH